MGRADYFKFGDWNAICQRCGFKYKASQLRLEWDNLRVCKQCHEPRQPQDFVRGIPDVQTPPWSLPDQAQTFVPSCSPNGRSAVPGVAVPGCAVPHFISPAYFNPSLIDAGIPNAVGPGCTLLSVQAIPGFAGPGCMIPSNINSGANGYTITNTDVSDN